MRVAPLDPENRIAFTDVFRPPAGYRLDAGIGTSYTLEFETFTALLLGFAGAELPDPSTDAATAMTVLARLKNHLRVFVNAGGLGTSRTEASRLYALYDAVLRPVNIPGAAFHPKVWVLKFNPHTRPENRAADPIYRFVCGSRNVTGSTCWELAVCLDGVEGETNRFSADIAAFLRRLPKSRKDTPAAVSGLLEQLPRVEFRHPSEAGESISFLGQWPGASPMHRRLPGKIDRALVMSPFVRGAFLETLIDRTERLTVVSRQEELDALPDAVRARLATSDLFVVTGDEGMDTPGLDLHAKLLVIETKERSETLIGSANATAAAWAQGCAGNSEAMVAMSPGLTVKAVRRSFIEGEKGELRGWIQRYVPQPVDEEARQADADFRAAQMAVVASNIAALYDGPSSSLTLCLERTSGAVVPAGVHVDVAPFLPAHDRRWMPYSKLAGSGVVIEKVPPAQVCAFLCVRMQLKERTREFVIQCALQISDDAANQRDEAISAALLEGADVGQVLLNILQDLPAGSGVGRGTGVDPAGAGRPLIEVLSIERVIEACTADPGKVDEIDAILRAVHTDPDIATFSAFWVQFRLALAEVNRA